MEDFKFNLGDEVKDKITGYKGIIRGRSQYLTGCNTYGLQSQKLAESNKPAEWVWVDEDLLEIIKKQKVKLNRDSSKGGPMSGDHFPPTR